MKSITHSLNLFEQFGFSRSYFHAKRYILARGILDDHAQVRIEDGEMGLGKVAEGVEAVVGVVFIALFDADVHEAQDGLHQGLVLLGFLLFHVLDVVKERNEALYSLQADLLVRILEVLDEEGEEDGVEGLEAIAGVIEDECEKHEAALAHEEFLCLGRLCLQYLIEFRPLVFREGLDGDLADELAHGSANDVDIFFEESLDEEELELLLDRGFEEGEVLGHVALEENGSKVAEVLLVVLGENGSERADAIGGFGEDLEDLGGFLDFFVVAGKNITEHLEELVLIELSRLTHLKFTN